MDDKNTHIYDYTTFYRDAEEFLEYSNKRIDGGWLKILVDNQCMLKKTSLVTSAEIFKVEYVVHFNASYNVPVLGFNVWNAKGNFMNIEFIMKLPGFESLRGIPNMAITQQEHPILFRPYYMIHACCTNDLLTCMKHSKNQLVTYLSTYGWFVGLNDDFHDYCNQDVGECGT